MVWIVRPASQEEPALPATGGARRRGALEVLLLRRPEGRGGGEHPVTGKADADETPAHCAEREAFEETGLCAELVELNFKHA